MKKILLTLLILLVTAGMGSALLTESQARTIVEDIHSKNIAIISTSSDATAQSELTDVFAAQSSANANVEADTILLVGGPCANPDAWAKYSIITCQNWPYEDGGGIIQLAKEGNTNVVLIAGTTRQDTILLTNDFLETIGYDTSFDSLQRIEGELVVNGNNDQTTQYNGREVDVEDIFIEGNVISSVTIDGKTYTSIEEGDTITLKDGTVLEVTSVSALQARFEQITSARTTVDLSTEVMIETGDSFSILSGDQVDVEVEGDMYTFSQVDTSSGSVESMEVNGNMYADINIGESVSVDGHTFRLTSATSSEAEFEVVN